MQVLSVSLPNKYLKVKKTSKGKYIYFLSRYLQGAPVISNVLFWLTELFLSQVIAKVLFCLTVFDIKRASSILIHLIDS